MFVASTIRNVDTYQYFKKVVGKCTAIVYSKRLFVHQALQHEGDQNDVFCAGSEGLVASEVTVGAPRQFYYDHSQTIEIVELKQP